MLHALLDAIDTNNAREAKRIVYDVYGADIGKCMKWLSPHDIISLLHMGCVNGRLHVRAYGHSNPFLHVVISNARCQGQELLFELLLKPRNRHLINLEAEIDDPLDMPDVRTTVLRYALNHDYEWAVKRLLLAGASTVRVVSATQVNGDNPLAPYHARHCACVKAICVLLCRRSRQQHGMPRDVALMVARLVWRKRYSSKWN